jgi:excisionase family DNA binding protein
VTVSVRPVGYSPSMTDLQLADIMNLLTSIDTRLKRLESVKVPAKLLSLRKAAKLLGVCRNTTLALMIQDRRIKTVMVAGQRRIPLAEVERIEREGATTYQAISKPATVKAPRGAPMADLSS